MADTLLQKEWKENDVNRIRNLITKKYGDKTTTQVGYTKIEQEHNEGDIWEENNKTWTIKNGIKILSSKLINLKKALQMPLLCPNCNKPMKKGELDKKMWFIHKQCFDCVIVFEDKLKIENKYEEYQNNILKTDIESYIKDLEEGLKEFISNPDETIVTEQGHIEKWSGTIDYNKIMKEYEEYISKLRALYK